ncbi:hypothetical protein [Bizionia sp. M204]|uniref:hypothetical protein n=1 Tax=unclassified Bizionia TaxID=2626393 RepID=UPI0020539186|nr:hypothetical protein [Bizionia sp. M204]UPS92586.1 hypothetical protein GMA17_13015 [Bizionia sp. M204]
MKNVIILFLTFVLFSCSSNNDSLEENTNVNPWNPTGVVRYEDIAAVRWYYNKEEFILEDGTLVAFSPSPCKKASSFYLGTNFIASIISKIDDGNGVCIGDGIDSHYSIYELGNGIFDITYRNEVGNYSENQYELFKIFDENYTYYGSENNDNLLIWVDDDIDEVYNNQQIITKKMYFTRWNN